MRFLRRLILSILWVVVMVISPADGQGDPVPAVTSERDELPLVGELYSPLTFPIPAAPSLSVNPFDGTIEIFGIFQSPSGRELVIPGFWMQPYVDRCPDCPSEDLQPEGAPGWLVRFSPDEVGNWAYTLQIRSNDSLVNTIEGQFDIMSSKLPGFIEVGANQRYFQFENGQPYFPIGHNLNWSWEGGGGLSTYRRWLQQLSEAGGNYARLIIDVPWFIGLEWERPAGDYRTAQKAAARLDAILEVAEQYGIALQLTLLWHQSLRFYDPPGVSVPESPDRPEVSADWDDSAYNVLNGGPLSGPGVFFIDDRARDLFRQRLRYIVARWGYSPQVFAWEVIDAIDQTANYDPQVAGDWLRDTVSFLRQIDQNRHLITVGTWQYDPAVTIDPLLDFNQGRYYQRRPLEDAADQVLGVLNTVRLPLATRLAPSLLSGFSLNPWFEPTEDDPSGVHFQNSLWAAALSGAAGGAVSDWWDTYVIPQGLTRYYAALAAFTTGIDWPNLDLQPAEAGLVIRDVSYVPVRIENFDHRFRAAPPPVDRITFTGDGLVPGTIGLLPAFLHGRVGSQNSGSPDYLISPPVDTYLDIKVRSVSDQAGARLVVNLDGQPATELNLDAGSKNLSLRVALTAGEHVVTLNNLGEDWLELESIEIGHLLAPARAVTLRDSQAGVALAWLHHREYTWEKVSAGVEREPVNAQYRLDKMPSGFYLVELWNPLTGAVLGNDVLRVANDGVLRVDLLPFDSQLAIRAFLQPDLTFPTATASQIPTPTVQPSKTPVPTATQPRPLVVITNTPRSTEAQE